MSNRNTIDKRISIFLTVDQYTIYNYFNSHDPAPVYKRQLAHEFQQYLTNAIENASRYSTIRYKIIYSTEADKRFAEPLVNAIRRHYISKKSLKQHEFNKFKRKNFILLGISLSIVMFCQGLLPFVLNYEHRLHTAFSNALDVFSWVILWKPIDKLIFQWNPYLKEINLLDKMINAEALIIDKHKEKVA
ncbi:hypothetical protein [Ferruginibacter albus]|uniref:hypothetical protein n=1 Tax=Ferruginibacter albus TaxID=2875540 RepID=UPI001CC7A364|nr:hypothetical protein [Ferruginibacter albus]UAY51962.1 hypothetical protein K9M53_15390 [Ferruginibacter albus]